MRYVFPSEVDRAFLVEALCAAGTYFSSLAEELADSHKSTTSSAPDAFVW